MICLKYESRRTKKYQVFCQDFRLDGLSDRQIGFLLACIPFDNTMFDGNLPLPCRLIPTDPGVPELWCVSLLYNQMLANTVFWNPLPVSTISIFTLNLMIFCLTWIWTVGILSTKILLTTHMHTNTHTHKAMINSHTIKYNQNKTMMMVIIWKYIYYIYTILKFIPHIPLLHLLVRFCSVVELNAFCVHSFIRYQTLQCKYLVFPRYYNDS